MTDNKWRIWEAKCLLLTQIKALPVRSLAKVAYQEAESRGWPGLGQEVRQICANIGLPDINKYHVRKLDIQKAIKASHYEDTISLFEGSSKLEDIKHDNFQAFQSYLNDKKFRKC